MNKSMKEKIKEVINELRKIWQGIIATTQIVFNLVLKIIGIIIIIVLLIWIAPKIIDFLTPDTWTLFVCKSKLNEAECYENSYEIPGFKTKKDCLLEGASRFSKQGFECGKNCKTDYGLNI